MFVADNNLILNVYVPFLGRVQDDVSWSCSENMGIPAGEGGITVISEMCEGL